jgi:hypothetical protein
VRVHAISIEDLLDPTVGVAPLYALRDFVELLAQGGSRQCGGCDFVFDADSSLPAALVLISTATGRICSALCRACCDAGMHGAAERAARHACGGDFKVMDPVFMPPTGGRA